MQNLPPPNSLAKITGPPASNMLIQKKNAIFDTAIFNSLRNIIVFFSPVFIFFCSCTSTKNTVYFQNLQKDTTLRNLATKNYEPVIQKNDLLGIAVASLSPDNAFYNAPQNTFGPLNGYLVDENGNIPFVKIGILHVEGMTRKELKDTLEKNLIPYLKDAVISVSFLNRHVTMLGGINSQVLPLIGDNVTILDALASSGDIGEKGRIDNVLVIREKEDNKEFKRLNLNDNSIFYSPYFYLQPNDIVYVEPKKIRANKTTQIVTYITAGITFIIFILDRLKL